MWAREGDLNVRKPRRQAETTAAQAEGPSTSPRARFTTTRSAFLAGLGSTGSLVAAVALAATVVTGTIAFTSWPGPPSGTGDAEVRLAVPDVPAAVTAAVVSTTAAAPPAAGASTADGNAASPGGTPPRPGAADGRGGAGPAPSSRSVTSPQTASSVPSSTTPGLGDGPTTTPSLGDATEVAGKSIGTGVATGTGDLAGGIDDFAPITAGTVESTGEVSAEAVSAAAQTVAEAIRVLPLENLQGAAQGGGGGG